MSVTCRCTFAQYPRTTSGFRPSRLRTSSQTVVDESCESDRGSILLECPQSLTAVGLCSRRPSCLPRPWLCLPLSCLGRKHPILGTNIGGFFPAPIFEDRRQDRDASELGPPLLAFELCPPNFSSPHPARCTLIMLFFPNSLSNIFRRQPVLPPSVRTSVRSFQRQIFLPAIDHACFRGPLRPGGTHSVIHGGSKRLRPGGGGGHAIGFQSSPRRGSAEVLGMFFSCSAVVSSTASSVSTGRPRDPKRLSAIPSDLWQT